MSHPKLFPFIVWFGYVQSFASPAQTEGISGESLTRMTAQFEY
jgi:hypothetical protein